MSFCVRDHSSIDGEVLWSSSNAIRERDVIVQKFLNRPSCHDNPPQRKIDQDTHAGLQRKMKFSHGSHGFHESNHQLQKGGTEDLKSIINDMQIERKVQHPTHLEKRKGSKI